MSTSTSLNPPASAPAGEPVNRLAPIRRLYFYIVALISFSIALVALDALLNYLIGLWLAGEAVATVYDAQYTRRMIAESGGGLLVATPIFLLHWGYMQRHLDEPGERGAGLRKLFLYIVSGIAIGYALVHGYQLLSGLANLAFGEELNANPLWPSDWLYHLAMLVIAVALQSYFHYVLKSDGDYGQEQGLAGTWRRLYQAIAGLVALGLLLLGAADILAAGWDLLTGALANEVTISFGLTRAQLSNGIALTLLGAVLARINWQRWRAITTHSTSEATTALRRFYLYAAVVMSALATLIPAAMLLYQLLRLLLGSATATWSALPDQLSESLPYLPAGLVAWFWYWRFLSAEAAEYGESAEGATVRRLYYYTVAATGLGMLWFGAVNVLQAIFDLLLVSDAGSRFWVELLATGLSLLIVGAPVWSVHWRTAQTLARRPDLVGAQERSSLPRRVYLYGVALAGALLILFHLAQVVYRLLLLLLGEPQADLFSAATVNDLARSVIAAGLWVVHVLAIRGDAQMGTVESALPALTVTEQRALLETRIQQLQSELAAAQAALDELPPA